MELHGQILEDLGTQRVDDFPFPQVKVAVEDHGEIPIHTLSDISLGGLRKKTF